MPDTTLIDILGLPAVLVAPGAAVLGLARSRYRGLEFLAAALGLSLAVTPLVLLWTTLAGLAWSSGAVRLIAVGTALGLAVSAGLAWRQRLADGRRRRRAVAPPGDRIAWTPPAEAPAPRAASARAGLGAPELTVLGCLGLALALRLFDGQALAVPAWVDGLHHTIISQAIADAGAVPSDLRPWVALDRFYYHFGFHAAAAMLMWLTGAGAPSAVLLLGQSLIALVSIPTWWLALRLTGSRWAAASAAVVPATLYWFPAYFVAWARYTQLTGLVVLPVAFVLLWDALESPPARRRAQHAAAIGLAAVAAGGLVLVHYRVAVFYAIGACVALLGAAAWPSSDRSAPARAPHVRGVLARFVAVALAGGVLVAPWLGRRVSDGVEAMAAIRADWFAWERASNTVPEWLLTVGDNRIWLAAGAIGILAGALAGRRDAAGMVATLTLCALATQPARFGLPATWMLPAFALAISLFLPVAVGLAYLVGTLERALGFSRAPRGAADRPGPEKWTGTELGTEAEAEAEAEVGAELGPEAGARRRPVGRRGRGRGRGRLDWLAASMVLGLAVVGAARMHLQLDVDGGTSTGIRTGTWSWTVRTMANPTQTEIFTMSDRAGMEWVRANTPPDARFLVSTGHWQLGSYRGLDGGYWLPILADRFASVPAALYTYGAKADVVATQSICERAARGDAMSDEELSELMRDGAFDYVYVGPAAARHAGFSADRLRRHPGLEAVFERDGVHVFRFRPEFVLPGAPEVDVAVPGDTLAAFSILRRTH